MCPTQRNYNIYARTSKSENRTTEENLMYHNFSTGTGDPGDYLVFLDKTYL